MYPYRTTIDQNIVTEFFPPYLGKKQARTNKVIIFCGGMPGMPGNQKTMEYYSKKGYWTLYPRYRGSWESGGEFLAQDPTQDILDVISALDQPFISAFDGKEFQIQNPEVYLIGISFGGPAAILGAKDPRVKKAISVAGVIDWKDQEGTEPFDELHHFVQLGFGQAYRYQKKNWDKLSRGEFYNPINEIKTLDPQKLLLIHAADDDVVPIDPTRKFVKKLGCAYIEKKEGGHLGSSAIGGKWTLRRRILQFLNK